MPSIILAHQKKFLSKCHEFLVTVTEDSSEIPIMVKKFRKEGILTILGGKELERILTFTKTILGMFYEESNASKEISKYYHRKTVIVIKEIIVVTPSGKEIIKANEKSSKFDIINQYADNYRDAIKV